MSKMTNLTKKHVNYGYVNWGTTDIEGTYGSTLIELSLYIKNENTAELCLKMTLLLSTII